MRRCRGFTLIEMLVVIIIITIMAGSTLMMMNTFFRGQGVRQGAVLVSQGVAQGKQMTAATRKIHFLVFSAKDQDAWLEIHEDTNSDGVYQGDQDPKTPDSDKLVDRSDLPQHVIFEVAPAYIGFQPSGYLTMYESGGSLFAEVQASTFDMIMNGSKPNAVGDVVLAIRNQPYKMCMDLDRASGKVRRHFFLAQAP